MKLGVINSSGSFGYEYLGSLVYTRNANDGFSLESASFGGGRFSVSETDSGRGYTPNYILTDHLGSTHIVCTVDADSRFTGGNKKSILYINIMENTIYVRLLDEGTLVYRPVPAVQVENDIFKVKGIEIYDPKSEVWEFPPDTYVRVEERTLDGGIALVAIKRHNQQ